MAPVLPLEAFMKSFICSCQSSTKKLLLCQYSYNEKCNHLKTSNMQCSSLEYPIQILLLSQLALAK